MTSRLLVIGGSGFIGSHVVDHALDLGWRVTSLSLRHGSRALPATVRALAVDTMDREGLRRVLEGSSFEYVVNCGGYIDHSDLRNGGRRVIDMHFDAVLNLVECIDRGPLLSFVNIGSSDEYGSAPAPQQESSREMPGTPYSMGKAAATHLLQMLHRAEGFPSTTLRLFLTYGPGQDQQRFIPQIVKACLEDRSFPVSTGMQLRDFCFVQDTVAALFRVFATTGVRGEVVNIGSGLPVPVRQVVEVVRRAVGKGSPRFGEIAYRSGESMALYADISKAKALLDWEPLIGLEEGISRTIDWMRETNS
jgi:nucleoside-diphosphate-sugar epimerase